MSDLGTWVDEWVRPEIRCMHAYPVPDATGLIKLDAMENPYLWPDSLIEKWLDRLKTVTVNRYPDPDATQLERQVRSVWQVDPSLQLLFGNGSDELLQLITLTFASEKHPILAPVPSFVVYKMVADFCRTSFVPVSLKPDFSLDLDAMLDAIAAEQPSIVFLAYPNNPTGNRFDTAEVEAIIEAAPGVVVIDEAYFPFASHSFLHEIAKHPRAILIRTVSKMGLAGLRCGILAGQPLLVEQINKVRMPYNINSLTQESVRFALENHEVFVEQIDQIVIERERLRKAFEEMSQFEVFPTEANFILLRVKTGNAAAVFDKLLEKRILVKNLSSADTLLENCLRITVGTNEENNLLLSALSG